MMKNKKGFTLIELLVCITILGIIMGMSIPVIRNITVKNSNTKYSAYLDVVEHAAMLIHMLMICLVIMNLDVLMLLLKIY